MFRIFIALLKYMAWCAVIFGVMTRYSGEDTVRQVGIMLCGLAAVDALAAAINGVRRLIKKRNRPSVRIKASFAKLKSAGRAKKKPVREKPEARQKDKPESKTIGQRINEMGTAISSLLPGEKKDVKAGEACKK